MYRLARIVWADTVISVTDTPVSVPSAARRSGVFGEMVSLTDCTESCPGNGSEESPTFAPFSISCLPSA